MINDIIDLSKIENGNLTLEIVEFNIYEMLDNLTSLILIMNYARDNLEIHFKIAPDIPKIIIGDSLRLSQILINLVNNAVKFTQKGDIIISIEVVEKGKDQVKLEFSVKDMGIGIPEEQISNIFLPFTQVDASVTGIHDGKGLGLNICRNLVQMMGCELNVTSKYGQGSTFFFSAVFGLNTNKGDRPLELDPGLKNIKALLVDDNPIAREILKKILTSFSIETFTACSGDECLAELEKPINGLPYDLMIMEWQMPEIDGIEISKQILSHPELPKIPLVIIVTALSKEHLKFNIELLGIGDILFKPVNPFILLNSILNVFKRKGLVSSPHYAFANPPPIELESIMGASILVVEDNEINLKKKEFDIILMGIQMPVMDGYQATIEIRKEEKFAELPIIAMTALTMDRHRGKSFEVGMNDYISKPIDPIQLFSKLLKWIKPKNKAICEEMNEKSSPKHTEENHFYLPDMPGLSVTDGLYNVGYNQEFYLNLLKKFQRDYCDIALQLKQALDQGNHELAQRLAHSVKGVSGSIGACGIQNIAAQLEDGIKEKKGMDINRLLDELNQQTAIVMSSINHLLSANSINEKMSTKKPKKALSNLSDLLSQLNGYILDREARPAKQIMKEILLYSWPENYSPMLHNLDSHVSKYKFKDAQKILTQLIGQIKNQKGNITALSHERKNL